MEKISIGARTMYDDEDDDDDLLEKASNVSALVGEYIVKYLCKEPCRSNNHTGHSWVHEILQGHLIRCYEMFRMGKLTFHKLCTNLANHGLVPTNSLGVEEMVAIFLNMVGNRMLQERF